MLITQDGGLAVLDLCLGAEVITLPAVAAKIQHSQSSSLQLFHPLSFPSVFLGAPSSLQAVHPSHPFPVKQVPSLSLHHSSQSHQVIYPEGVKNILSCSCRPGM